MLWHIASDEYVSIDIILLTAVWLSLWAQYRVCKPCQSVWCLFGASGLVGAFWQAGNGPLMYVLLTAMFRTWLLL